VQRRPGAVEIGVVARLQRGDERRADDGVHEAASVGTMRRGGSGTKPDVVSI
jgi:hypothetical protein